MTFRDLWQYSHSSPGGRKDPPFTKIGFLRGDSYAAYLNIWDGADWEWPKNSAFSYLVGYFVMTSGCSLSLGRLLCAGEQVYDV